MKGSKLTAIVLALTALTLAGPAWAGDGAPATESTCWVFNPNSSPVRDQFCAHMDPARPEASSAADQASAPPLRRAKRCNLTGARGSGRRATCKVRLHDPNRARLARAKLIRGRRPIARGAVARSGRVTLTAYRGRSLITGTYTLIVTERLAEGRVVTRRTVQLIK